MQATVTISADVESVGIQTIAIALGVTGSDEQCRVHWANHLKTITAQLYVRGDQIKRANQADAAAVAAAASKITVV
jgi:hypothetical protein